MSPLHGQLGTPSSAVGFSFDHSKAHRRTRVFFDLDMTKHPFCAFSAALLLAACSDSKQTDIQRVEETPTPSRAPASEAKKETKIVSTMPEPAQPKSTSLVAPVPEPEKIVKPSVGSTVWATQRISVTTGDGIFSVAPGKALLITKVTATGYGVNDGRTNFEVTEAQVTSNVNATAEVVQAELAMQAAAADAKRTQNAVNEQKRVASAVTEQAAALNLRRRDLTNKRDALVREEATLRASLEQARIQESRAREARILGRVYTKSIPAVQETAWATRLAVVETEQDRVREELNRLP